MNVLARFLALLLWLALAGCGGGMQAGVGSGGSGAPLAVGLGPVTGFGSIFVNGERHDETSAQILVDERPDRATPATVAAIRLGMRVELQHRNLVVSTAVAGAELVGPVSSVFGSSFVALGQTVQVNSDPARPTVFDGFSALADLAAGAIVEVHGDRSDAGDILATRVELRPAGLNLTRVAGTASNVNGRNFSIGTLAIDGSAASFVPAAAILANGQRVVAWTDAPYVGGPLAAKVVRIGGLTLANNAAVALDGAVGNFQSTASFRVSGVPVDARGATFIGGTAADLTNGRAVRVRGTYGSGTLRATSVEFVGATQVQLTGPVNDFVDLATAFRIRNALALVTPQTTYAGGSAANLGSGVLARVTGSIVNGVVNAATVEFLPLTAGVQRVVFGPVAAPPGTVASDGTFTVSLDGIAATVQATAATSYKNGVTADIAPGRQLKVKGTLQGVQFLADEIQFMDNPASPPTLEIAGIMSNVQASSATINGQVLQLAGSTVYTLNGAAASSASLKNGAKVEILASRVAGALTAQVVDIKSEDNSTSSVRGLVSGRTPPDAVAFLVGSQRVNVAGNPRIVPANRSLADVVNGSDLEVEGIIADGVLNATRVRFR